MTGKRSLSETIRHDLIGILLERMQGGMQSHSMDQMNAFTVPESVEEICDIPYINRHGIPLAMDIYKPKAEENTELPVIITIHGGGLVMGDRKLSRRYAIELAKRGYLVFSIEYRLAPRANVAQQFDDVCAGMDFVGQKLVEFNVDFTRIFLTAESAGAFLAIYVAAMKNSAKLQEAIGYKPTRMVFKGIGLMGGMFYTRDKDPLGLLLADQLYGDKMYEDQFMQFMDPEHPEIVGNLPPAFLITSCGDFLNNYTIRYHEALKHAGRKSHLLYYGEEELGHAFPIMQADAKQSADAIDRMIAWFEQEADRQRNTSDEHKEKQTQKAQLDKRLESGEVNKQKLWKYLLETSKVCNEDIASTAVSDNHHRYQYHRLYHRWRNYAEVFSALGITGENNRRIGMIADSSAYAGFILCGADMVGTAVSFYPSDQLLKTDKLISLLKEEKITDLIIEDHIVPASYAKKLLSRKEETGIVNIIVSHRSVKESETVSLQMAEKAAANRLQLKEVKGLLYMRELLKQYEAAPLKLNDKSDRIALITHHIDEESGEVQPQMFTDTQINKRISADFALLKDGTIHGNIALVTNDFSHAHALIEMFLLMIAAGRKTVIVPCASANRNLSSSIMKSHISQLTVTYAQLKQMMKKGIKLNVFDSILIVHDEFTEEDKKKLQKLKASDGKNVNISIAVSDPADGSLTDIERIEAESSDLDEA